MTKKEKDKRISLNADGSYTVRLRYTDAFGKKVDRKRKAKSLQEAEKILRKLQTEKRTIVREYKDTFENVLQFSVAKYMKTYFLPYKSDLKGQSYRRLESTVESHIIANHGMKIWSQITAEDINSLLQKLYNDGKSQSSIKKVYDAYNAMFKFAVNIRRDLDPADNPMNAVKMISEHKFQKKEVNWLKPDEIIRFAEEAKKTFSTGQPVYKYGKVFLFLINTGLREGEVCALNKADIDFENKILRIDKGVNTIAEKRPDGSNAFSVIITSPKTKNSVRFVPLSEEAIKLARDIMSDFPKGERFIYNAYDKIVRPDTLIKQFKSILSNAGLQKRGLHTLRHTFVTVLFENNIDIHVIAEIIGDTVETVSKTYLHLYKARKAKAVKNVNVIENMKNYVV